jgi:hypothetical protein
MTTQAPDSSPKTSSARFCTSASSVRMTSLPGTAGRDPPTSSATTRPRASTSTLLPPGSPRSDLSSAFSTPWRPMRKLGLNNSGGRLLALVT